ncbi:hypothetical protein HPB52_011653 [Rhipicephalus sanguineus]|uniref:CCHC-type domain-containing protein n=1 Tax=Rhipicephalus sanguineus TaxID=34632 RepID=A0A9D4YNJ3_RHISA|nr:hypothetical protein HPB52_011653 [Rhipicephalus sanguineus]
MCAAVYATVYDVPLSGAPEQPTDNLHRRSGLQNAFIQPPTMVSSWDDHRYTVPRGRFGDVREAPVCFYCGFRGHVARFCAQRRRAPQRHYEGPPPSPRQNSWRGEVTGFCGNGAQTEGPEQVVLELWPTTGHFPFLELSFRNALMEAAVVHLQHCHYTPKVKPVPNDGTSSAASINDNCVALDLGPSQAENGEK